MGWNHFSIPKLQWWLMDSTHKGPGTRKTFPCRDVTMLDCTLHTKIINWYPSSLQGISNYNPFERVGWNYLSIPKLQWWLMDSTHKGPGTRTAFPCREVIMLDCKMHPKILNWYPSSLLKWHWGNHMVAQMAVKQPWRMWENESTKTKMINPNTSNPDKIYLSFMEHIAILVYIFETYPYLNIVIQSWYVVKKSKRKCWFLISNFKSA